MVWGNGCVLLILTFIRNDSNSAHQYTVDLYYNSRYLVCYHCVLCYFVCVPNARETVDWYRWGGRVEGGWGALLFCLLMWWYPASAPDGGDRVVETLWREAVVVFVVDGEFQQFGRTSQALSRSPWTPRCPPAVWAIEGTTLDAVHGGQPYLEVVDGVEGLGVSAGYVTT